MGSSRAVRQTSIDSRNGHENRLGDYLCDRAAQLDLAAVPQPVDARRSNLIIGCRMLLNSPAFAHLDTVHPTWEGQEEVETVGHEVRGLGALDDKGGIVASLLGSDVAGAGGVPLDGVPATLALTVDEEEDGLESATCAPEVRPKRAIVLEATGLDVAVAGAGSVEVEVVFSGRSAHGSIPVQGDKAIDKAARFVTALHRLPVLHQEDQLALPPRRCCNSTGDHMCM